MTGSPDALPTPASALAVRRFGPGGEKPAGLLGRLLVTLAALLVFRLGCVIPIASVDPDAAIQRLAELYTGQLIGDFGAGYPYGWTSIFGLWLAPYMLALLIRRLGRLVWGDGRGSTSEEHDQKTRALTFVCAALMALAYQPNSMPAVADDVPFRMTTVASLTAGAMLLMWLAQQITRRGVGHGPSLIIATTYIADFPVVVLGELELSRVGAITFQSLMVTFAIVPAIIAAVVYFERARRRLLVVYPAPTDRRPSEGGLRLNEAGIYPPLFAMSAWYVFTVVVPFFAPGEAGQSDLLYGVALALDPSGAPGLLLQAVMIVLIACLFRHALREPREVASKLAADGAFIPGVRPGESTARYIASGQTSLAMIGSVYLVIVCLGPMLLVHANGGWIYRSLVGLVIAAITFVDMFERVRTGSQSY